MSHETSIDFLRYALSTKAVGLGEAHDNPRARDLLISWMQEELINDIVVEMGGFTAAPISDDPMYVQMVGACDRKWPGNTRFETLFAVAAAYDVNVHAWDPCVPSLPDRNKAVAHAFRGHFGRGRYAVTQAPGCVVLYGAHHFGVEEHKLNRLLLGLYWANLSG